jgi:hypothetical protein
MEGENQWFTNLSKYILIISQFKVIVTPGVLNIWCQDSKQKFQKLIVFIMHDCTGVSLKVMQFHQLSKKRQCTLNINNKKKGKEEIMALSCLQGLCSWYLC